MDTGQIVTKNIVLREVFVSREQAAIPSEILSASRLLFQKVTYHDFIIKLGVYVLRVMQDRAIPFRCRMV